MAATPSVMTPLGSKAPDFKLPDTISGNHVSLQDVKGKKATVVMFICNHCPYVKHVNPALVKIARELKSGDVSFVAISSNDIKQYPEDGPQQMKVTAKQGGYTFPYLYDETQEVARAYDAACTPDFFVYDSDLALAYRGQFDDSRPGNNIPVTGSDLRKAIETLVAGKQVSPKQKPSIGCNIKWKS